ncbi:type VII secretion system-associated protein [Saccharopolyspora sp. CA-218241]|uniref:type VII secretion system-associated protein n=1 Tax=Saccharopolyspora sp. CA-218241 TaxID=3240027 RepID=UPI003D96B872
MQPSEQGAPPITDAMRDYARENPGNWLYIVDPGYQDAGDDVPPEGVVGAYYIDDNGDIDEEFQFNSAYEPSDLAGELPEPTNSLEEVLQGIANGELPEDRLPEAVLDGEVLLYSPEDAGDAEAVYAAEMSDGSQLVPACTSESRVPADWPGARRVAGADLPALLGGLDLGLNLTDAVQAVIPNSVLAEAAASR